MSSFFCIFAPRFENAPIRFIIYNLDYHNEKSLVQYFIIIQ